MPKAVQGTLDLEGWDFAVSGPLILEGEWQFYPYQFLAAGDPRDVATDTCGFIVAPGLWNTFNIDTEPMGAYGYGTYRLITHVKETDIDYGLQIPDFATAYRLFINGKEVAANGEPGTSRLTSRPQWRPQVAIFQTDTPDIEILIHVANFAHVKGGMWEALSLGTASQILRKKDLAIGLNLFSFGSLMMIGIYHTCIFLMWKQERAGLFLGLFCVMVALRGIATGEVFLSTAMPDLDFELLSKIEYLSAFGAVAAFLAFMSSTYTTAMLASGRKYVYLVIAVSTLIVVTLPLRVYARLLFPLQLIAVTVFVYGFGVVIKALYRKQSGTHWLSIGIVALVASVINDIAYANRLHGIGGLSNTMPFGLLVFILSQTLVVAERFYLALNSAEALAVDLESKVRQRTYELEKANQRLQIAATKDSLTTLNNRYQLYSTIEKENQVPVDGDYSLMYIDLDNFKQFNDMHGHEVGDFVLQQFADVLVEATGDAEKIYRIGGDEFCVLLPGESAGFAKRLAEALITILGERRFPFQALEDSLGMAVNEYSEVACSIGIASYVPGHAFDLKELLATADQAMLKAKESGKQRIHIVETSL